MRFTVDRFLICGLLLWLLTLSLLPQVSRAALWSWFGFTQPSPSSPKDASSSSTPETTTGTTASAKTSDTASGKDTKSTQGENAKSAATNQINGEAHVTTSAAATSNTDNEEEDSIITEDQQINFSDLVSPILNRELLASIKAHQWPSSPQNVFCEAYAFHAQEGLADDFLHRLVSLLQLPVQENYDSPTSSIVFSHESALDLVLKASPYTSSSQKALLQWFLAMRAASPLCELHRSLAVDAFSSFQSDPTSDVDGSDEDSWFTVVYPSGRVTRDWKTVVEATLEESEKEGAETTTSDDFKLESVLLEGEPMFRGISTVAVDDDKDDSASASSPSSKPVVIIYANLGTQAFAEAYQALVQSNVRFVVRHLGTFQNIIDKSDQISSSSTKAAMVLQGYGVSLDIRNVEYKVFDERSDKDKKSGEIQFVNLSDVNTMNNLELPPGFLAGVNLTALKQSGVDWNTDNGSEGESLEASLWKTHEAQQLHSQIVPPVWQRRQLPLQAALVIAASQGDALVTLQEISQNLPSLASTLVHIKIPDPPKDEASSRDGENGHTSSSLVDPRLHRLTDLLYVNGRSVNLGGPTFNVFELMNLLREEQRNVRELERKLLPLELTHLQLQAVQQAWSRGAKVFVKNAKSSEGSSEEGDVDDGEDDDDEGPGAKALTYRVDVGHGWKKSIMYLNDLEKDKQYARWPKKLDQMLMKMQFGGPPSVRRNLFTILVVMDPLEEGKSEDGKKKSKPDAAALNVAFQIMRSQFPARLGILMVNEAEVRECAKWVTSNSIDKGKACPAGPIMEEKPSSVDELKHFKATTHAVHRLMTYFASEHGDQEGALQAYLEYLLQFLEDEKQKQGGELSMYDLVRVHLSLLEGMGMPADADVEADAFSALLEKADEENDEYHYGLALRFAADKALFPGLCFINGRPVPSDDKTGEGMATLFREEQGHVFNMIIRREITDKEPKSVYGKLLSGSNVFASYHPLLRSSVDTEDMYVETSHSFGKESLLLPEAMTDPKGPFFVLEAVTDYSTREGVQHASGIIDLMQPFPSFVTQSGDSGEAIHLAYRFVPGSAAAAESVLCPFFAHASLLGSNALKTVLATFMEAEDSPSVGSLLDALPDITDEATQAISSQSAKDKCLGYRTTAERVSGNFVTLNGRKFEPGNGSSLDRQTVEILLNLELSRAKVVTKLLGKSGPTNPDSVARVVSFLSREESLAAAGLSQKRSTPFQEFVSSNDDRFSFIWNNETNEHDGLKPNVVAIVDPITFAAQRMSPLLRIIRDKLGLPLTLLLAPAELIDGDAKIPITSYYRFVASTDLLNDGGAIPEAHFENLPINHVLTLRVDVPEPWNVQQSSSIQDTDNLRCDTKSGCGDEHHSEDDKPLHQQRHLTKVEYDLKSLLIFGRCAETTGRPPNGLQLVLSRAKSSTTATAEKSRKINRDEADVELGMDGSILVSRKLEEDGQDADVGASSVADRKSEYYSDTLVMLNMGYWQLQAAPGVWSLEIANGTKGAEIFDIVEGTYRGNKIIIDLDHLADAKRKKIVLKDFVNIGEVLFVRRRPGFEHESLFPEDGDDDSSSLVTKDDGNNEVINVFSLATGHLYERFLKIMMLSVTKRTSSKVKFWLFENFLSPSFKASARFMAEQIGNEVEFVTYKWPEWLRDQSEKQRIIWGYKILFLDVLFPLNVKKFIYVDADQVLRGDLKELWDLDLKGAPYGYTPFCSSRETTLGYQFWREGFWKQHLRGSPYHISALYVVDLERFRRQHVGDTLRAIYQQLSADPNSLANLDQDLPNYAQHQVRIFSLPQEWLWCESWCSDETKPVAKTIDLCNNPLHKEPKVSMAKRIISGPLFNESWVELDAEVERYDQIYRESLQYQPHQQILNNANN